MTQNSPEFRIKHLLLFLSACVAYSVIALEFALVTGAITLFTALLLSIEPEGDTKGKYPSLAIALATGLATRLLSVIGPQITDSWLPETITALAGAIFVLSHVRSSQLRSSIPLFFFLLLFSFLAVGDEATRYVALVFFPLAASFALSVVLIRINERVRVHKRARLRKERSIK